MSVIPGRAKAKIVGAYGRYSDESSKNCRNVHFLRDRTANVLGIVDASRQSGGLMRDFPIGNQAEQVLNAIEPGFLLVHCIDDPPWRLMDMRPFQHRFFGFGILFPSPVWPKN